MPGRRTPSTGAEMALEEMAWQNRARRHGRSPDRVSGAWGALSWEGALPVDHPLADSPSEARAKRLARERREGR